MYFASQIINEYYQGRPQDFLQGRGEGVQPMSHSSNFLVTVITVHAYSSGTWTCLCFHGPVWPSHGNCRYL